MDLNRAQLIGNVTRDPELRNTPGGQSVCTFGVATNAQWTDAQGQRQQRAEFHNLVAWGKLAEICSQYLSKGKKVYVEGRLQTRDWEAQDGAKRTRTEIVLDNMIMLDRAGDRPAASGSIGPATTPEPNEPTLSPVEDKGSGEKEIRVEDIPF
ncbi:MAG TPA: single-stranded DNA-binding protein [Patescibacteria group bacterium]|nr:single-stranded DNA-binding protein [Patescibacteria group bacterium]